MPIHLTLVIKYTGLCIASLYTVHTYRLTRQERLQKSEISSSKSYHGLVMKQLACCFLCQKLMIEYEHAHEFSSKRE